VAGQGVITSTRLLTACKLFDGLTPSEVDIIRTATRQV
jgi:hypothetical protein